MLTSIVIILSFCTYSLCRYRALTYQTIKCKSVTLVRSVGNFRTPLPNYYGLYGFFFTLLPALGVLAVWAGISPRVLRWLTLQKYLQDASEQTLAKLSSTDLSLIFMQIRNAALGIMPITPELQKSVTLLLELERRNTTLLWLTVLLTAIAGALYAMHKSRKKSQVNLVVESIMLRLLQASALFAILITTGIIGSLLLESLRFFSLVSPMEFLFGTKWSPQLAIRPDQVGSSGAFGAVPLFTGTLLIALIALLVAGPLGVFSAIYLAEYASVSFRRFAKPIIEILAGIPTVVYGFFAALTVAPYIKQIGEALAMSVAAESALAAGLVMGVMIIPLVSSLSDDVINAVPQALRDAGLALGSTQSETIRRIVLPAALPGIIASLLLAASRAIGETMIVVMAAGLAANLTFNPLDNVTTATVQIVTALVGDQSFDSPKTLSVFALGLVLLLATLALNALAYEIIRRFKEAYD